jgi:hypothetical protein
MLECYGPADRERQAIDTVPKGFSWTKGKRFATPPTGPLQVKMDGDGILMPMFNRGILLFSDDLVSAIRGSGVDNIDCYDAVLIDPVANQAYTNYKAVNIIGLIAAVDLGKSKYHMPSGVARIDTDFDSVVIDESKTGDLLLFRLAECVTAIVVHERVRGYIERAGIPYLTFVDPIRWFG